MRSSRPAGHLTHQQSSSTSPCYRRRAAHVKARDWTLVDQEIKLFKIAKIVYSINPRVRIRILIFSHLSECQDRNPDPRKKKRGALDFRAPPV